MNFIKNIFHKHIPVYTERKLIGYGERDCTVGPMIDIQPTNIYLTKAYCIGCKEQFTTRLEILQIFDKPQPYDVKS